MPYVFGEPADETRPCRLCAGSRSTAPLRRRSHVDTVGDLHGVAAQVFTCTRWPAGHRDPRGDLLQEWCRISWNALSARDGSRGVERRHDRPSATISARKDRLGAVGSCRCSTSKSWSRIHLRAWRTTGTKDSRATDRCTGCQRRPAGVTNGGTGCPRRPASTSTSCRAGAAPWPGPSRAPGHRRARRASTGRRCDFMRVNTRSARSPATAFGSCASRRPAAIRREHVGQRCVAAATPALSATRIGGWIRKPQPSSVTSCDRSSAAPVARQQRRAPAAGRFAEERDRYAAEVRSRSLTRQMICWRVVVGTARRTGAAHAVSGRISKRATPGRPRTAVQRLRPQPLHHRGETA